MAGEHTDACLFKSGGSVQGTPFALASAFGNTPLTHCFVVACLGPVSTAPEGCSSPALAGPRPAQLRSTKVIFPSALARHFYSAYTWGSHDTALATCKYVDF